MTDIPWAERRKAFAAGVDADQVELQSFLDGTTSVNVGTADERMAGVIDDEVEAKGNDWGVRQQLLEDLSASIVDELTRRQELMGEAYPFQFDGSSLIHCASRTGAYEFSLIASRYPAARVDGAYTSASIFEFLCRDIVISYFGGVVDGLRTGYPFYGFEGGRTTARSSIEWLNSHCGEFIWGPKPGFPDDPPITLLKDAGVDFVVWRRWSEITPRFGQFFMLGQCACGKNDVDSKASELNLERLRSFVHVTPYAAPSKCYCVSHHVPSQMHLLELARDGGIVFDRARIALIANEWPGRLSPEGLNYLQMAELYAAHAVD